MTVVVTRDVADRYHGFLSSIMPEVGPGTYVSPELSRGVRDRIWTVLSGWWDGMPGGSSDRVEGRSQRWPFGAAYAGSAAPDAGRSGWGIAGPPGIG
jgi:hypothetical protein